MKTKLLAIFALAAVLMACDNQGKNEPKYVPGHEVILTVGAGSAANQVPSRKINGVITQQQGEYELTGDVNWSWNDGDTLGVLYNGKWSKFTMIEFEKKTSGSDAGNPTSNGWAKFKGYMPEGYVDGEPFEVFAGPNHAPEEQNVTVTDKIAPNRMRFHANNCHIGENIQLFAIWSLVRIEIKIEDQMGESVAKQIENDATYETNAKAIKISLFNGSTTAKDAQAEPVCYANTNITVHSQKGSPQSQAFRVVFVVESDTWVNGVSARVDFDASACTGWIKTSSTAVPDGKDANTKYALVVSQFSNVLKKSGSFTLEPNKGYDFPITTVGPIWAWGDKITE